MFVPSTIYVENEELKQNQSKSVSLSTILSNLYTTKLILQTKQKIRIDLSKVTSENTRAVLLAPLRHID